MRKPSFFERLTGSISPDDYDDLFDADRERGSERGRPHALHDEETDGTENEINATASQTHPLAHEEEPEEEGELSVDIYQTPEHIIVKALVAGVNPANVDISLTRDMITIRGTREEHREVEEEDYFYKELYWGTFSRTILLPEEVDVDLAEANTDHGILVIKLPKINKDRKTKIKVKPLR